jgi:hypothetical protein
MGGFPGWTSDNPEYQARARERQGARVAENDCRIGGSYKKMQVAASFI